ncbi:MAG TPA: hypothetical protein VF008_12815 [Niastella sp.]
MAPCAGSSAKDVWFQFTATDTVQVIQLYSNNLMNPVIEIFSGSCGSLTSIACHNAPLENNLTRKTITGLTIGNSYYIRVYGNYATGGFFTLCIVQPAANDECGGAIEIPVNAGTSWTSYTNGNNHANFASGTGCITTNRGDGWFKFTAQDSVQLIHMTGPSSTNFSWNTRIQVYEGICGSLTQISGMRYDGLLTNCFFPGTSDGYYALRGLTAGNTYYISVLQDMSYSQNNSGTFNIAISNVPTNDGITGAQEIPVNAGTTCTSKVTGNFRNASPTIGVTHNCGQYYSFYGTDLWYKFTATSSRHLIAADFYTAVQNPGFQIYYMNNGNLQPVTCGVGNNTYFTDLTSLTPGTVYYIRVKTASGYFTDRFFDLCITTPGTIPANDACSAAQTIALSQQSLSTISGATFTPGMNTGCNFTGGSAIDVWYTFTPSVNTSALLQFVIPNTGNYSSNNNLGIEVHTGACGALTRINCANINAQTNTNLNFTANVGTTYYVRIFSFNSAQTTPFLLSLIDFVSLPVTITTFEAEHTRHGSVKITWNVQEEAKINYYDIERSTNGIQFNKIARIPARNLTNPSEYGSEDLSPLNGISYYRLKIVDRDEKIEYSKIVKVNIDGSFIGNLQVGRQGNSILINNRNTEFKNITLNIYSVTGQRLYSAPNRLTAGVNRIYVPGKSNQPLFIHIITEDNEAKTFKTF